MKGSSPGVVGRLMPVVILSMFCLLPMPPHHQAAAASIHGKANKFRDNTQMNPKEGVKEEAGMELYPTGSSLPDCSHACGPCFPCKRVMISFRCSMAESCPVVYRCMCKGKYYHVPSN
ncbi:Protein EPIDERMAL PATTERNING FACTOR 2 [Hibiscus syriacus]|uniref:Epidermal patterning factor-like protein n=1 Tax=Hibiscus syriacus TaxID=106335 RepID=A0A6A2WX81_HIBSY|nr:Protein EPIDERMAL PATTERNING FACTOR 2 [Hibiscus syriacus]